MFETNFFMLPALSPLRFESVEYTLLDVFELVFEKIVLVEFVGLRLYRPYRGLIL